MRKFATNILIRDNRLEMMQDNSLLVDYEILSDEDYIAELKNKLLEESAELCGAKDINEIKEEIADVQEVLEHLLSFYKINETEISEIKLKKQRKIGKFERRIKTHFIEMEEDNLEELEYYLNRPEKYPEII